MTLGDGPIVEAVREARAKIAAECEHDLQRLGERLRKIEAEHPDKVRSLKKHAHRPPGTSREG
jgi:hypothetical protein